MTLIPLTRLKPKPGDDIPVEIRFPDGSIRQIQYWYEVITEAVRWLNSNGYRLYPLCPISIPNSRTRYILHTSRRHSNGREFAYPHEVDGLFYEHDDSCDKLVTNAQIIIERTGQNPSQFKVRLSSQ